MLVNEAEDWSGQHLDVDVESYLIYMLQRFLKKPGLANEIAALNYLDSLSTQPSQRADKLREIGDKCLLYSGFFPGIADRRHVTVSYYVMLGRHAFQDLAELPTLNTLSANLFILVKEHFVSMMDLLLSIRTLGCGEQTSILSISQARELWESTGSRYAFNLLQNEKLQPSP